MNIIKKVTIIEYNHNTAANKTIDIGDMLATVPNESDLGMPLEKYENLIYDIDHSQASYE